MNAMHTNRHATRLGLLGTAVLTLGLTGCEDPAASQLAGADDALTTEVTEAGGREAHIPGGGRGTAVYVAELRPLNADPAFGIDAVNGQAIFTESRGGLEVKVNARGLAPNTLHVQHVHVGDACPTEAEDVNADGFVDVLEGVPVYGAILVPLDDDLADLGSQLGGFPTPTNRGGAITYRAGDSMAELNAATQAAIGEDLDLATRHVVLHGVAAGTGLPGTVASLGGFPAEVTLPVACGEIVQVNRL